MHSNHNSIKQADVLGGALVHKLFDTGLAHLIRRGPIGKLTQPYYSGLSRLGFQSGMSRSPKVLFPKSRYALGGMLPSVSGVGDYEFGRLMGHYAGQVSDDVRSLIRPGGSTFVTQAANDKDLTSPLLRNFIGGLHDRIANKPIPRLVNSLVSRFSGPEVQQPAVGAGISALTGIAGAITHADPMAGLGAAISNAPDTLALSWLSKYKHLGLLKNLKERVLMRGFNQAQAPVPFRSQVANAALGVANPTSYEFMQMGNDIGRKAYMHPALANMMEGYSANTLARMNIPKRYVPSQNVSVAA